MLKVSQKDTAKGGWVMNAVELKAEMVRHGDTSRTLAMALGISRQRFSAKLNEKDGAEFTQWEIAAIVRRYDLSAEQTKLIFFASNVS